MKAVVVEIKDRYAALLQDDGNVVKMKSKNFSIGDVINIEEKTMPKKSRFTAIALAVAVVLMMLMGTGVWTYATPYYYVSLDVNPSVLMNVNRFERVIGISAMNEDAVAVLEGLNLKNKGINYAISEAVSSIVEAGYLTEEGGNIVIASAAKNDDKSERLANKLKVTVEKQIDENGLKAEVAAGAMGYSMVQEAKDLGITPGKLNIINNLLGEEATQENIDTPVKDLMSRFTTEKAATGKAIAEQAKNNAGKTDDVDVGVDGEPLNNADLTEQNIMGKPNQAGNAPSTPPGLTKGIFDIEDEEDVEEEDDEDEVESAGRLNNKPKTPGKPANPAANKP